MITHRWSWPKAAFFFQTVLLCFCRVLDVHWNHSCCRHAHMSHFCCIYIKKLILWSQVFISKAVELLQHSIMASYFHMYMIYASSASSHLIEAVDCVWLYKNSHPRVSSWVVSIFTSQAHPPSTLWSKNQLKDPLVESQTNLGSVLGAVLKKLHLATAMSTLDIKWTQIKYKKAWASCRVQQRFRPTPSGSLTAITPLVTRSY